MKNFKDFTNEKIKLWPNHNSEKWGKKPWIWIKNIMQLEEPEDDEDESKDPNGQIKMEINFKPGLLTIHRY